MSRIIREMARTMPDGLALADERMSLTWAEVERELDRATRALSGLDLGPDERVAVFARNCAENVLVYQAALHAGISSVPVSAQFTADEVAYILKNSRSRVIFAGPETAEMAVAAAKRVGTPQVIAWRTGPGVGTQDWAEFLKSPGKGGVPVDIVPRPQLHYTSGTTGRPKGVETPPALFPADGGLDNFFEAIRNSGRVVGDPAIALIVSPMHHTGPLISVRALGAGLALVVMSKFDAEAVLKTIETQKISTVLMVPTHFTRLLALPDEVCGKYDLSSLEEVLHTGAPCPRDVKRKMIDWFGPILFEAYGATESGTTNMISSSEWLERPGSVGKTIPPFEPIVLDESGEPLGTNEVGVLYFRDTSGRGVIYHQDAEKTRSVHHAPGVFTLGDMGYVDDEGYVFITDRISDMIISGGVNIYPAEVEEVLGSHPLVDDVAVIGTPNDEMGEEVKALVVPLDPENPPDADALEKFCRERLAGYKRPRSIDIVETIGRNALGKINKRELRKKYWPDDRTIGG